MTGVLTGNGEETQTLKTTEAAIWSDASTSKMPRIAGKHPKPEEARLLPSRFQQGVSSLHFASGLVAFRTVRQHIFFVILL